MTISDASLKHAEEEHYCPHCEKKLSCCAAPPMHVGDGLGWGSEIFFICLNDECSLYSNGWQHIEDQYGQIASYRYMILPGEKKGTPMMVGSGIAFTGSELDVKGLKENSDRYKREQEALKQLETCVQDKLLQPIICLIVDEEANLEGRQLACVKLEELADIACIDPIRNHTFRHTEIQQQANIAISNILKKTFQKECPDCSEIIKAKAKVCKHCGKETKEA